MKLWEQYLVAAFILGSLVMIIGQLQRIVKALERKP